MQHHKPIKRLNIKLSTTPILWMTFFTVTFFAFNHIVQLYVEPREIHISKQQAREIGNKIWRNEGNNDNKNLVIWHEGEAFPSLGLGHFIWYPAGVEHRYTETFPDLIQYISQTREIPTWLKQQKTPPWTTRKDFYDKLNSDFTRKLRHFLQDTMAEQTQFIVLRLEAALPKMLKAIKNGFTRQAVRTNFYHVANQKNGIYALVDYVNFKGEGVLSSERYNNQGWGLLQVLEHMDKNQRDPLRAFVDSASQRLIRRVANAPQDESKWLPLWLKRIQSYLD